MKNWTSACLSSATMPKRALVRSNLFAWARRGCLALLGTIVAVVAAALPAAAVNSSSDGGRPYLNRLDQSVEIGSTVPANGDVNPYGVAVVDRSVGRLVAGDVLVSNFNAKSNFQGTGSTIVEIAPNGHQTLFAHIEPTTLHSSCPGGVGLTTALSVLSDGFVVVGSLPTNAGTLEPGASGCLIVLSPTGTASFTVAGGAINGPWDMTVLRGEGQDQLFVTNVLNGTLAGGGATVRRGTIVRLTFNVKGAVPSLTDSTIIGSGFPERTDPAALVVGPTGVSLGLDGTLYVANSVANDIRAIPNAAERGSSDGIGSLVSSGGNLSDPLGMALAPNGDILTANGTNGNIVETTPDGVQVAKRLVDSNPMPGPQPGNGALFGLAVAPRVGLYFVDDDNNDLNLLSR